MLDMEFIRSGDVFKKSVLKQSFEDDYGPVEIEIVSFVRQSITHDSHAIAQLRDRWIQISHRLVLYKRTPSRKNTGKMIERNKIILFEGKHSLDKDIAAEIDTQTKNVIDTFLNINNDLIENGFLLEENKEAI